MFFISVRRRLHLRRGPLHRPLPLRQLPRPPTLHLEEGVGAVRQHGREPEEGGGAEGGAVLRLRGGVHGGREVEEGPHCAEDHLDEHPGDDVELLDDVEEVEDEEGAGRPEPGHGDEAEPLARRGGQPVASAEQQADEANEVQDLWRKWECRFQVQLLNISEF